MLDLEYPTTNMISAILSQIAEVDMLTAILIGAAGLLIVAWHEVLAPMARLLELSEDLAGVQAGSRLENPANRLLQDAQGANDPVIPCVLFPAHLAR